MIAIGDNAKPKCNAFRLKMEFWLNLPLPETEIKNYISKYK